MANLSNVHLFDFRNFDHHTVQDKRVGHNRTVTHSQEGWSDVITGKLHGHPVFKFKHFVQGRVDFYIVEFDTCGYMTATTREAMTDFLRASGFRGAASIAKGQLSVRLVDAEGQGYNLPPKGTHRVECDLAEKDMAVLHRELA